MFGDITPDAVAYQCVIAGCRPAELPVVLAAAEATLEPDFNLLGIATTTGTACVALCVHGPIARKLGINAGTNCLGPGNRANASIGRALQLCHPQHRRRALRDRRHGDHGPARQVHASASPSATTAPSPP